MTGAKTVFGKVIGYCLERLNVFGFGWFWTLWFGSAIGTLLTKWPVFMWVFKGMVCLLVGGIFLGMILAVVVGTWDLLFKTYRWLTTTREHREQEKLTRRNFRGADAPFDHWEPPAGRD